MFNKDEVSSQEIETVIGPTVVVEGNFAGHGNVVVEGAINGTLKTDGAVRIGKEAKVKAEIKGLNVYIAGEVRGNISAGESLELSETARVYGNIQTKNLIIASGASFQGKSAMGNISESVDKPKMNKNKPAQEKE